MKVWDRGPWFAKWTARGLMIDSDDFTHDASLIVYGDFKDDRQRMRYAKYIATLLNGATAGLRGDIERSRPTCPS